MTHPFIQQLNEQANRPTTPTTAPLLLPDERQGLLDQIDQLTTTLDQMRALVQTNTRHDDALKVAAVQEFVSGLVRDEGSLLGLGDLLPPMKDYFSGLASGLKAPEVYALYCSDVECPTRVAVYFDRDLAEEDKRAMQAWQAGIIDDTTDEALAYIDSAPVGNMGMSCLTGEFHVVPIEIRTGDHDG